MKIVEKYINSIIERTATSMSGQNKVCYPKKHTVLLKSKYQFDTFKQTSKQNRSFINTVRRADNINIPRIIFYTSSATGDYQLQSRAKGKPVAFWQSDSYLNHLKNISPEIFTQLQNESQNFIDNLEVEEIINSTNGNFPIKHPIDKAIIEHNNQTFKEILNCNDKHLTKALNDFYTLIYKYGCFMDAHSENLYFDKNKGFSYIDIDAENRSLDVSDSIGHVFKSFINNYFDATPYEDTETRFLRGLIAKKSFYCFKNSQYCNSDGIKQIESFDQYDLTIPTDQEYESLRILLTTNPSESKYQQSENFLKSMNGPDFNINEIDTNFILSYLDNHTEYDFEFNPEVKPIYEFCSLDDDTSIEDPSDSPVF